MQELLKFETVKAVGAELVGTFFLTLAAFIGGSPFAVALTLTAFVYAIGNVSGCNINPAVTLGLVSAGRLPILVGIFYIIAQIGGALLAYLVAGIAGQTAPEYHSANPMAEFLGFGFLILTVVAVSDKNVPKSGSGIAIGAALAAGLVTTKGILNPAVAISMGLVFSPAVWATLLSSLVFAKVYQLYALTEKPKEAQAFKNEE